ncbi:MAG: hypothetical protein WCF16_03105 [Alphaproteobacteria bacterium]
MTNTQLVDDLITITGRLVVLMTKEIEHIRVHRVREIEGLQPEKASLARAYETIVRELRRQPGALTDLAPAIKQELAVKAQEFQRLLLTNEAALRAAKEVNAKVLKAIADAVVAAQNETGGYSKPAAGTRRAGHASPPTPITFNQTL